MIITGVGSRHITDEGKNRIIEVCKYLNNSNNIIRSGGADGSDTIFEENLNNCIKEIFLPWKGFNNNPSPYYNMINEAYSLASTIHPYYFRLKTGSKKLHARNMCQVLGYNLDKPSDILICWTKDGCYNEHSSTIDTGGTRSAIVLADRYNIPIYNLNIDEHYNFLINYLSQNPAGD